MSSVIWQVPGSTKPHRIIIVNVIYHQSYGRFQGVLSPTEPVRARPPIGKGEGNVGATFQSAVSIRNAVSASVSATAPNAFALDCCC